MSEEIAKWDRDDILERLDREGVPNAPVLSRTEIIENAQTKNNALIEEFEDPDIGTIRQPRPAARFSETPASISGPAPFLGGQNTEILTELGYSADDIDRMNAAGILAADAKPTND